MTATASRPTSTPPAPRPRRRGGRLVRLLDGLRVRLLDGLRERLLDGLREGLRDGRRVRLLGGAAGILVTVIAAAAVLWLTQVIGHGTSPAASNVPVSWRRPVVSADGLVQQSGVKITQVAVTGDGGLVDLRFRVIDPDRASSVHDPATPPAVVDEVSGLVVHELFMNHAHTGPYQAGVTYYLVFNNPGNWIHHGSRVSVMLGNAQVEHVLVP